MISDATTATGAPPKESETWDLVIRSGLSEKNYWRDLWRYRELLYFLTWRDILVRYKQTVAGAAWAIASGSVGTSPDGDCHSTSTKVHDPIASPAIKGSFYGG